MKIKTIDVTANEWFDRVNRNSYFSAEIMLNFGMKSVKCILIPMEYGYGEHYKDVALKALIRDKYIKETDAYMALWRYCEDNKIILRCTKREGCLKRDLYKG